MTLEHVNSEIEKVEMDENSNFGQRLINATKRTTSSKRMSYLTVYSDMKQTSAEFSLKSLNIRTPCLSTLVVTA